MSSSYDYLRPSRGGALVPEAAAAALLRRANIFAKPALLCPHAGRESEREREKTMFPLILPLLALYTSRLFVSRSTQFMEKKKKGKKEKNTTSLAAVCAEKNGPRDDEPQ